MSFIIAAIPVFLILIAIELIADKVRGTGYYQFNDALNSLNLGVLSRVSGILLAAIPISAYYWLYHNHAIWQLSDQSIAVWFFAFIAYDLGYYWVHRLGHRVSVMWGSHVVHHSSEEYNLTTALRQTSTPSLFGWIIYLPMAVIGVSPELAVACGSLNLIYQFWVHTRHVDKLPQWYEAIFVTPSHHRVHHALNRDYIDKNFAGVFILWDKLFGSFQPEKNEVKIVYGVSHQLKSWNPVWANFQVYWNLCIDALHTRKIKDKIKVFFMPPGWRPSDVKQKFPRRYATTKTMVKYDVEISSSYKAYLLIHFIVFLGLIFAFILSVASNNLLTNWTLCAVAILNLVVISSIQEQKYWHVWAEPVRVIITAFTLNTMLIPFQINWLTEILLASSILSIISFTRLKRRENEPVHSTS
ncbi:sterol desaturase family protein [Thalassotalea sp. M1531]|uniref:Sterol desaturase family protein n=1 Tax=Thalassotalea algicola TaxID=2716224 RepID=A0A7Y0L9L3_9GAMM|nr:sterol desaturase family protein [Thalassotalea algicola]NMP30179.1 sterol desaturase family protein [Thalassotalea algicola]